MLGELRASLREVILLLEMHLGVDPRRAVGVADDEVHHRREQRQPAYHHRGDQARLPLETHFVAHRPLPINHSERKD